MLCGKETNDNNDLGLSFYCVPITVTHTDGEGLMVSNKLGLTLMAATFYVCFLGGMSECVPMWQH
jgi:hypothetical protein